MLTEQNYVTIQKIIAKLTEVITPHRGCGVEMVDKEKLVEMLSNYFELDNRRFNRRMFFEGCNG